MTGYLIRIRTRISQTPADTDIVTDEIANQRCHFKCISFRIDIFQQRHKFEIIIHMFRVGNVAPTIHCPFGINVFITIPRSYLFSLAESTVTAQTEAKADSLFFSYFVYSLFVCERGSVVIIFQIKFIDIQCTAFTSCKIISIAACRSYNHYIRWSYICFPIFDIY